MQRLNRQGQSVVEYALLFALVIGSVAAIGLYAGRGVKAKIKDGTDAYTSIGGDISGGGITATVGTQNQYEPYYVESSFKTVQENIEQEHMGDGRIKKEIVSNVTGRTGVQKQRGTEDRSNRENLFTGAP